MDDETGTGRDGRLAWDRLLSWYNAALSPHGAENDGDEALEALADSGQVRRLLDQIEFEAVRAARRKGRSWAEIAVRLGVTRQSAWERWRDVDDAAGPQPAAPGSPHEGPSGFEAAAGIVRGMFSRSSGAPHEQVLEPTAAQRRKRSSVRVPDVVGMTRDEARKVLGAQHLSAIAADPDGPPLEAVGWPDSLVLDQSPESGAKVPPNSPVRLWLDHGRGPGVREPRRPAPDPRSGRQMRDEATDEAVG